MGAQAVCIGRPYLWGLGAFGQLGVERVLEILRRETRAAMQEVGGAINQAPNPRLWCSGPELESPWDKRPRSGTRQRCC